MLYRRPCTDCQFLKSECPGAERVSVEKVMKDRDVQKPRLHFSLQGSFNMLKQTCKQYTIHPKYITYRQNIYSILKEVGCDLEKQLMSILLPGHAPKVESEPDQ